MTEEREKNGRGFNRETDFNRIVLEYGPRVYKVVRGMVDTHEDADDVVQEVFMKAYKSFDRFRGDSDIGTWLIRIGMNSALSRLRRKKIFSATPSEEFDEVLPSYGVTPEEAAIENERRRLVRKGLSELPVKQRRVFVLRMYDELSFREIADSLGITEGAARANFHQSIKKLQAFVKGRADN